MSALERRRFLVFERVASGELSLVSASEMLEVSYRQTKRLWRRFQDSGAAGLVHLGRGRTSNHSCDMEFRERVLELYRELYMDYGPTLAAECMAAENETEVPASTLRRWLSEAGLYKRRRRSRKHRRSRPRRRHWGELVQLDGSHHDWFEGRRQGFCSRESYPGWAMLMVMIDDATGWVYARFYENESWHSATDVFRRYVNQYGLPSGLYVDQHSIYRNDRQATDEEILGKRRPETQFGRAMRELGVELILANSAQAKGRVERMNGTLQDRLVKALRRRDISDLVRANEFLENEFLDDLNARFSVEAASDENWHSELSLETDLDRVHSIQEERVVQNDWTVRWRNQLLQLEGEAFSMTQPGSRIVVCEQQNGSLRMFAGDVELEWSPAGRTITSNERRSKDQSKGKSRKRKGPTGSSQGNKPPPDHPWR